MSNPTAPSNTIAGTTTLAAIEQKVRRLTRRMSTSQLSQADLDNYINTFVVYDFPETLRTFNLKTTFTFYTNPGQDVYNTDIASFGMNAAAQNNPLYNFQNKYLSVEGPWYCSGNRMWSTQYPDQFWSSYPYLANIQTVGAYGDGMTVTYMGIINTQAQVAPPGYTQNLGLIQGQVVFDSIAADGTGLSMQDVPVINIYGQKTSIGNLYDTNLPGYAAALANPPTVVNAANTINYLTGVYTVTFTSAPAQNVAINSQVVPYQQSQPFSVLYFSNKFTLRPIPDQVYPINFEVFQRPSALLSAGQSPELEEYWQFIAYGASRKVLQDAMELETVALIEPEFFHQQALCERRTLVQLYANQRTPTIYDNTEFGPGARSWGNSAFPF